jgi:hypothetical protein
MKETRLLKTTFAAASMLMLTQCQRNHATPATPAPRPGPSIPPAIPRSHDVTEFTYLQQFSDEDYFNENPMDDLEFALLDLPEKSVIVLEGPRRWDRDQHPEFRAVACFKNPPDFAPQFQPSRRSSKILIDLQTGETSIESFPKPTKTLSPSPSVSNQIAGPDVERKDIAYPASKFTGPWGRWRLFVYTGKILSNPLDFETGSQFLSTADKPLPLSLTQPPSAFEMTSESFATRSGSRNPSAPGISVVVEPNPITIDGRVFKIPAIVSISIADDLPATQLRIPVRLLFGADVNSANRDLEILIPKARMTKTDAGLVGHHTLDLAPLLVDSSTGKSVVPKEWYLTAICKGVFAGPQTLTIPVR